MPEPELYVDSEALLTNLLDELNTVGLIALDTEFVREKTYYPQLCLIQIAAGDSIACIDCLADIDLDALYESLLRDECTWIVHSSRQDLEVIFQHTERLPSTLIDTQIAAGLVGYAPQISLQDLVADTLGVELDKSHTRTDWSRRPLPSAAIEYARDDVRSLHALWDVLAAKLDALGRREWLDQDCALLLAQDPVTPVDQIFSRLKGARSLDASAQCAALALVEWREERARRRDRPRRWILSDEQLVGIARARPRSVAALAAEDVPKKLAEHAGHDILAALERSATSDYPARIARLSDAEKPEKHQLRELQARAKARAAELDIYPEVLATKQDLIVLLLGRESVRVSETWRAAELRPLLEGLE
ncbi:MAG: ribonuclease D [Gammaproteobacteria bacterium]|nr:ribonuclease D [Gammaproteobacteria bacterium]